MSQAIRYLPRYQIIAPINGEDVKNRLCFTRTSYGKQNKRKLAAVLFHIQSWLIATRSFFVGDEKGDIRIFQNLEGLYSIRDSFRNEFVVHHGKEML